MDKALVELDKVSSIVTCSASVGWHDLEQLLNEERYTLGYCNPRFNEVSIGTLVTKNYDNLYARYYGQPAQWCVSVLMRGKNGKSYENRMVPRTAAGPDFRSLLLGMGSRFGRLEDLTLKIHVLPEAIEWVWSYWNEAAGAESLIDELEAIHIHPSFAGVYQTKDLPADLKKTGMSLLSLRFVGLEGMVRCYRERATTLTKEKGGKTVRMSRRKTAPLLERLLEKGI